MADYDNGLPPEDINIDSKNITNIVIGKSDFKQSEITDNISAILISKSDFTPTDRPSNAKHIIVVKEDAGQNVSMFL